jgi:hypothetical protein
VSEVKIHPFIAPVQPREKESPFYVGEAPTPDALWQHAAGQSQKSMEEMVERLTEGAPVFNLEVFSYDSDEYPYDLKHFGSAQIDRLLEHFDTNFDTLRERLLKEDDLYNLQVEHDCYEPKIGYLVNKGHVKDIEIFAGLRSHSLGLPLLSTMYENLFEDDGTSPFFLGGFALVSGPGYSIRAVSGGYSSINLALDTRQGYAMLLQIRGQLLDQPDYFMVEKAEPDATSNLHPAQELDALQVVTTATFYKNQSA